MKTILAAFATGTALSAVAVGLLGSLGPATPLHLSRDLWADYRPLGGAAGVSPLTAFGLSAVIYAACFLVAGLRLRRHAPAPQPEPEPMQLEEAQPWYS